jgi:protein involved in polysaccharide export with SLBB domain
MSSALARSREELPCRGPAPRRALLGLVAALVSAALGGCTAITNPVANGPPVSELSPKLLAEPREGMTTIPLSLLRQKVPEAYQLGPGDVLGIWVEGILPPGTAGVPGGAQTSAPPYQYPETPGLPPAVGIPIPILANGTIVLPLIEPLKVQGMTVEQVQEAIREAYTVKRKILQPGRGIIVTLVRKRVYQVLVFREDTSGVSVAPTGGAQAPSRAIGFSITSAEVGGTSRQGTGYAVDLPAYENDVLHALAATGGLPGVRAEDEIVIQRDSFRTEQERTNLLHALEAAGPGCNPLTADGQPGRTIRIPLRSWPGQVPPIRPEDVILQTGDIIYIRDRLPEFFYTAGLLPAGQHQIPRDYDLDVIEAVTLIGGPILTGGISTLNINGTLVLPGFGQPSPSLLTVLRRTPDGGQVPIRVDLNRALRDPRERILVKARDVLILQESPDEAIDRYVSQQFKINILGFFVRERDLIGTANLNVP